MQSHDVDFQIFGEDLQYVEIELDPGETVIAEAGAMLWMEEGITFETKMGDGSEPDKGFLGRLAGGAKRSISGESLFMTHFTNRGGGRQKVAVAGAALARTSWGTSSNGEREAGGDSPVPTGRWHGGRSREVAACPGRPPDVSGHGAGVLRPLSQTSPVCGRRRCSVFTRYIGGGPPRPENGCMRARCD
jgi:hypothetical protein